MGGPDERLANDANLPAGHQRVQRRRALVGRQPGALQQRRRRQRAGAGQGGQQQFVRRAAVESLEACDHIGAKTAVAAAGPGVEDAPAAQCGSRRGAAQDEAVAAHGGHRLDQGQLQPAFSAGRDVLAADDAGTGGHFGRAKEELDFGVVGQRGVGVGQMAVMGVEAQGGAHDAAGGNDLAAAERLAVDAA